MKKVSTVAAKQSRNVSDCTPDGKWVVYNGPSSDGVGHIFKISIDGGLLWNWLVEPVLTRRFRQTAD